MTTRAANIQFLLAGMSNPSTGEPVESGTVYFYEAGTTTQKYVWTEIAKTNGYYSYSLDAVGAAQLYAEGNYKIVVKDSAGATVYTLDNIRLEFPYYGIRSVVSTTTQLTQDDFLLVDTTGGAVTINALAAALWTRPLKIQRIAGSNNITFDPSGSETIDGSATLVISSDAIVEIISDGSNLRSAGFRSSFADADNDTKIQVEESADEDKVRIDTGGTERVVVDATGLAVTGDMSATGDISASGGDFTLTRTSDDAVGAAVAAVKTSTTPADDDELLQISATGNDSGANATEFAKLELFSSDVTDAVEAGEVTISVLMNGTYRNLVNANGYNGTPDQGEVVVNEDGQDVDFRVESAVSANGFKVQGSDGAVTIAGAVTISGAADVGGNLDIGASTTKRVAPAGTFTDTANGDSHIGASLQVDVTLTVSTWESVGPTGSGADHIWSAMDSIPADADWVELVWYSSVSMTAGPANQVNIIEGYARATGSSAGADGTTRVTKCTFYSNSSGNGASESDGTKKVPLGTGGAIDCIWAAAGSGSNVWVIAIQGWGFNP